MRLRMQIMTVVLLAVLGSGCLAATNEPLSTPGGPPICPHILTAKWPDSLVNYTKGAPWVKVLDIMSCGVVKQQGGRAFYRPWDNQGGNDGKPGLGGEAWGKGILERLSHLPKNLWPDAISFQNEFNNVSPETAKCFMDMYDVLRAGGYEGMIVFGSYGPGGPTDMTEWERPYIKAACLKADAIETHEYWDLTVKNYDMWLAHRHVNSMQRYPWLKNKPWFIGEFGSDAVAKGEDKQNRSGWQDRGKLTADEYIKQIEIYRHGDKADGVVAPADNVMAVFLFGQGDVKWKNYETMGTKVADYMKSTWPPTVGYITGKITDEKGNPVEGAQVELYPSDKQMITDAKGVYWLFAVKPGDYTIRAGRVGVPESVKVSVKAGDILTKNITLKQQARPVY